MSYPPYGGGGYPPQQPGFPGAPGYPQPGGYPPPGGAGMPTPESANAAAYGSSAGGLPYAPQPGGPGGIGFNQPGGYPPQPGYPGQGYPGQAPAPGYNPQPPGGYGGAAPAYGQPQGGAPPYGAPPAAGGYGAPPAAGGYGAPPAAGGYGAPPVAQPPGGYGAPPMSQPAGGYGAPPATQPPGGYGAPPGGHPPAGGYGAPPGGYGGAPAQQPPANYGGYGQGQGGGGGSANYGNVPGPAKYKIHEEGTLKPASNFNVEQDVQVLRKAMKGLGTDEKAIIDVLGHRSCDQRQNIKMMYKTCFGRDLVSDLKSELGGRFEDASVALMMKREEFDAYELRRAMRGAGTDEAALIEILCTRTNAQIHSLTAAYKLMYGRKLEDDIISETSGHFRKLLVSMSVGGRQENQQVDMNKAQTDAQRLYQAGEKRWGTDENTFNMILASQSYEQCRAVFDAYSQVSKHDIEQAIRNEMSGDVSSGMLTIIRMIRSKHSYFADRLYHSMKGLGTDDRTLIRVIVSRCEVDMKQIKAEFQKRYGQGLEAFVRDDVSGDYRKLMLALISGY
ncbi:annexin-B12 isoform X2 [Aplysia californica]|uniref:Annexin n=1 Tax=Aplysia californica TaxID=6500 RepID=A0ABM0JTR5_APLCA|nr:annexin-B12 isoform X2 [Aplysia californica]